MISRDVWSSLSEDKKVEKISECLQELYNIDHGVSHIGTNKDGQLCNLKRDLEQFVINAAAWESGKDKL